MHNPILYDGRNFSDAFRCYYQPFMMEGIFPMLSAVITSRCVILPMVM